MASSILLREWSFQKKVRRATPEYQGKQQLSGFYLEQGGALVLQGKRWRRIPGSHFGFSGTLRLWSPACSGEEVALLG